MKRVYKILIGNLGAIGEHTIFYTLAFKFKLSVGLDEFGYLVADLSQYL